MTTLPIAAVPALLIDVDGPPVPKGSMIGLHRGGRVVVVPNNETQLRHWTTDAVKAMHGAMQRDHWQMLDGPCEVVIACYLERPAAAAHREFPHVAPDVDKIGRAVLDALQTAGVVRNDARVVDLRVVKRYAERLVGTRIAVTPL